MHTKKKNKWNEWQQKLTPIYSGEKTLMSRQQQHHCFYKKQDTHHIEIVFNLKARKRLVFFPQLRKQKHILVLWFSGMVGKLYCEMKNVSYFPNHDVLIRTLQFHLFSKISKYYKTYGNKAITFLYKFGFSNTFMSRFYLFRKQKADVTFWQ